jgi:2'-5' RNA ligase
LTASRQSALVVLVPAAEPVVGSWRARLDPAASLGIPAHVTVLYPFIPPSQIGTDTVASLARIFGSEAPFSLQLTRIGWFDHHVVYCVPQPEQRFCQLTERVVAQWPDFPPYQGAFAEFVPHLTIGDGAPLHDMRQAAADVECHLPLCERVDAVHLMEGTDDLASWAVVRMFPLAR